MSRRAAIVAGGWAAALVLAAWGGFVAHRVLAPRAIPIQSLTRNAPTSDSAPAEPRKIPDRLPDVPLPDRDGVVRRLSDWKGHPLLVNFWATWCAPCRREIPLLKSLRQEHVAESLEVVGIALDAGTEVQVFARESRIDYPVLIGEERGLDAVTALGMDTVLPFSVFADHDGRIIALKVGELHRDEAELILHTLADVEHGRLSRETARDQIAVGMRELAVRRAMHPA